MNGKGTDTQGTGLIDVYRILLELPTERLLSVTFQLGESPEEDIVQALCLILLRRGPQALYRLQTRKDNHLASHLAETWQNSGGVLENFKVKCNEIQAVAPESWVGLARIFKVLSEKKLCEPLLRDLAYQRAISAVSQDPGDARHRELTESLNIDNLKEEAKLVCSPQLAEWLCSGCFNDNTDSPTTLSQEELSLPSPLQVDRSTVSYPSHLEISTTPTATVEGDRTTVKSDHRQPSMTFFLASEVCTGPDVNESSPKAPSGAVDSRMLTANAKPNTDTHGFASTGESSSNLSGYTAPTPSQKNITIHTNSPKPTSAPSPRQHVPPKTNVLEKTREEESDEDDDDDEKAVFYSFVILHSPEDVAMADSIKVKLESFNIGPGAIFSDDFAIPGKRTLRCIEDAINNSAFTILLLTRNFNTRRLEMETDSALINSIYKKHKYNTVIPLLPTENCLPRKSLPIVLQTLVILEENSYFEKGIKKSITGKKLASNKRIWEEEQRANEQVKRRERLERSNMLQEQYIQEAQRTDQMERERARLLESELKLLHLRLGLATQPPQPPESHIHIENAKYIMIGSNSNMTVGRGTTEDDADNNDD